jgi:hypothetical protein
MRIIKEIGESDDNCPICGGTGYKRQITFGTPGYIDEVCICVKESKQ